jgi:hypothetical protein
MSLAKIGALAGVDRSGVGYALRKAEILAASPSSELSEVYALAVAA